MKSALRMLGNVAVRVFHLRSRSFCQRLFGVGLVACSFISFLAFLIFSFPVYAAPNLQINYQGKLTDASNVAVADGNYIMQFRLYTSATGATTTNIWEEIRTTAGDRASVSSGLFSIMLGSTTPLTGVNFNQTLYLGVEVCGTVDLSGCDGEMTPRKVLGAVPAAFEANKLNGFDFTSGFLSSASSTITNLTMINSTSTNATTTNLYVSGTATTTFGGGLNLSTGNVNLANGSYLINNANTLSATTLGSLVVNSSLTSVGTLGALTVSGLSTLTGSLLVNNATSTITNLTMVNSTSTNATTTNLAIGTLNGPLQAINGLVSASTSLSTVYGGTGITSYTSGDIIFANATNHLTTLAKSTNGFVLKLAGGVPSWDVDLTTGGGSGAGTWSTTTTSVAGIYINYPNDPGNTDIVAIGGVATTTAPFWFDPNNGGLAYFGASLLVNAATSTITNLTLVNSTTTNATTTNLYVSSNMNLNTGLSYNIAGTSVLNATTLGANVVGSSLTSVGTLGSLTVSGVSTLTGGILANAATSTITNLTLVNSTTTSATTTNLYVSGNMNLISGLSYNIAGTSVLNSTTLGTTVINSSLTSVGTLGSLTVTGLSTLNGGLLVNNATSTITNLTIVNSTTTNATTTNLYVSGSATSTFGGGVNLSTGNVNLATGGSYLINNANVLSATTLGPLVVNSSLTSVGTLTSLTVSGALVVNSTTATSTFSTGGFTIGTSQFVVQQNSGFVGIGTTTPSDKLTLYNGSFRQVPGNPTLTGSVSIGSVPASVAVSGRYAYVIDSGSDDLKIIDVSFPTKPVIISSLALGSVPTDIAVAGRYAYITDSGSDDLKIIDLANPGIPSQLSSLAISNPATIAISGHYVYIGTDTNLNVVDISNPSNPLIISSLTLSPSDIAISGRYAYIVSGTTLSVIDISNPASLLEVGTYSINSTCGSGFCYPSALAVAGRYAYVVSRLVSCSPFVCGSNEGALDIISIATSTAPTLASRLTYHSLTFLTYGVAAAGRYVYIPMDGSFQIVDTASSTAPVNVGSLATGSAPTSIFVAGRYAYVVDSSSDDLKIIDLSGIEVTSGIIHSLEAGTLQVRQDSAFDQNLSIRGGLSIGTGGLYSSGPISISLASTTQTNPTSAYFQGNVGLGTTTPTRTFDVVGNWGGNSFVDAGAYVADQTVTVSTKALVYHLTNNTGSTNSDVILTYNITGLTNTEGAFALIYTFAKKGGTGSPVASEVDIQINGTQVSRIFTPSQTGASTDKIESYVVAYSNGAWHIFGAPSTQDLADLAEWIEAEGEKPVAGELVSFSSEPVKARRTTIAYDPNLMGVISTNPHTVMGEETPTSVQLTLAGRVPVKVSGENGTIGIGDYLTSSSIPGTAMKATKAGRVVGRALESFTGSDEEIGQVLVLVETADWPGPNLAEVLAGMASTTASLDARLTALENAPQELTATAPPIDSVILESLVASPSFFTSFAVHITSWLADVTNGISDLFANTFHAKEKVCIGATCVNEEELKSLLNSINVRPEPLPIPVPITTETSTLPIIPNEANEANEATTTTTTEDLSPVNSPEPTEIPSPEPPVVPETVP